MLYIYLIKPAEFIDTECYKVGLSSKCDLNRLKSYGADTEYIQYFSCKNFEQAEKEIIFNLNQCVRSWKEYFAGDKKVILKVFVKVMNKYIQMDLDNEEENKETQKQNMTYRDRDETENAYKYNTCFDGLVFMCIACDYSTKVKCNFSSHISSSNCKRHTNRCNHKMNL